MFSKDNLIKLTPIEKFGNIFVKRDDLFEVFGVCGGKARSCYQLILDGINKGYTKFVTAGSRKSPQCELVSTICENLGVNCILFMPDSEKTTSVLENIKNNKHTTLIRKFKQGSFNNVLISQAKHFVEENKDSYYIPFGMEFIENIDITKKQVRNIPECVKRIVVPVGSGMTFCSIANGLLEENRLDIELVGIRVGKDPTEVFKKYLYKVSNKLLNPHKQLNYKIIKSPHSYDKEVDASIGEIKLDPIYEAKCVDYLQDGDLFWVVGKRK